MELLRYVLPHLAAGSLAGLVGAAVLVATNTGSLRDLVLHTQGGWLAFALLAFGFVGTFGSIAAGGAIMGLREDE
jgi:hypothetical protein